MCCLIAVEKKKKADRVFAWCDNPFRSPLGPHGFIQEDTAISACAGKKPEVTPPLVKVLTHNSAAAVDWLTERFGLDLSLVSRLGGHSFPRTHRGKVPVVATRNYLVH
jgi:hypothetical protein